MHGRDEERYIFLQRIMLQVHYQLQVVFHHNTSTYRHALLDKNFCHKKSLP